MATVLRCSLDDDEILELYFNSYNSEEDSNFLRFKTGDLDVNPTQVLRKLFRKIHRQIGLFCALSRRLDQHWLAAGKRATPGLTCYIYMYLAPVFLQILFIYCLKKRCGNLLFLRQIAVSNLIKSGEHKSTMPVDAVNVMPIYGNQLRSQKLKYLLLISNIYPIKNKNKHQNF